MLARPRIQLGVHINIDGRFSVITSNASDDDTPDNPADLASWGAAGWSVAWPVHGNGDRGAQLTLQKGSPLANTAQAILAIEKNGKRFTVTARWVYGSDEPGKWKDLDSWADAGWTVTDTTGNLEHGAFWMLAPPKAADSP